MKLSEAKGAYEDSTRTLSNINRQLCFAGFAVIWIFNKTSLNFSIPHELIFPSVCFMASLIFDILQYIISTIIWYIKYLHGNKGGNDDSEFTIEVKECVNLPMWIFFFLKIIALCIGYGFLIAFLIKLI